MNIGDEASVVDQINLTVPGNLTIGSTGVVTTSTISSVVNTELVNTGLFDVKASTTIGAADDAHTTPW